MGHKVRDKRAVGEQVAAAAGELHARDRRREAWAMPVAPRRRRICVAGSARLEGEQALVHPRACSGVLVKECAPARMARGLRHERGRRLLEGKQGDAGQKPPLLADRISGRLYTRGIHRLGCPGCGTESGIQCDLSYLHSCGARSERRAGVAATEAAAPSVGSW